MLIKIYGLENLTVEEQILINDSVKKNRTNVYLFVRNLPRNSKRRLKYFITQAILVFNLFQPLGQYSSSAIMSKPINRL